MCERLVDPQIEDVAPIRTIGLYDKNRIEWIFTDIAAMLTGVVTVTLYDTLGESSTPHIINESELETIVCSANHVASLATLK